MKYSFRPGVKGVLMMLAGGALVLPLLGQPADRPPSKFGGFLPTKKAPGEPPPLREDANRLVEIFVELAWLGDPLTFPFYLEARVEHNRLEVRGNVPSRMVREHAMKVARLYSPMIVVDGMRENPNLTVRHLKMTIPQLHSAVQTALRETMPRQVKNLQARCSADGRVVVSGGVSSFEEKLSISQALRRLHGCTAVGNIVQVASDPDGALSRSFSRNQPIAGREPVKPAPKQPDPTPPTRTASNPNNSARPVAMPGSPGQPKGTPVSRVNETPPTGIPSTPPVGVPVGNPLANPPANPVISVPATPLDRGTPIALGQPKDLPAPPAQVPPGQAPPSKPAQPNANPTPPAPNPTPLNPQRNAPKLNPAQLQKRILDSCPLAKEVRVAMTPGGELRVDVVARRAEDGDQLAGQVLSHPDLAAYRVDLHIELPQ